MGTRVNAPSRRLGLFRAGDWRRTSRRARYGHESDRVKALEAQAAAHKERQAARVLLRWRASFASKSFLAWAEHVASERRFRKRAARFRVTWDGHRARAVLHNWKDYNATRETLDFKVLVGGWRAGRDSARAAPAVIHRAHQS